MITKEPYPTGKIHLDLNGPEGNAYYLLALARKLSRTLELDWSEIEKEMTSDDYEHLVKTFDNYFGDFVVLHV